MKLEGNKIKIEVFKSNVIRDRGMPFTFDMETLHIQKDRIPLDYCHDDEQIIGFCENFNISNDGVTCDAVLFEYPDDPGNIANVVKSNLESGVPYEASGFWDMTEIDDVEDWIELDDDDSAEFNGKLLDGPMWIFRNVTLRGVAICPHGADKDTSTVLATSAKFAGIDAFTSRAYKRTNSVKVVDEYVPDPINTEVTITSKETKMDEQKTNAPDSVGLQAYVDEFGKERGVDYYLSGKTLDEARAEDYAELKARRLELESREGGAADGDANADASINEAFEKLSAEVESLKRQVEVLTSVRLGDPVGVSENPVDQKTVATNPIQAYAEKHAKRNS